MSAEDVQMVIDEDKIDPSLEDKPGFQVQIQLLGNPYRRDVSGGKIQKAGEHVPGWQTRLVRIMGGYDVGEEDTLIFEPARTSSIQPFEYEQRPLSEASELFNLSNDEIQRLDNARKKGASSPFVDTDQMVRDRGGDPDYKIIKPSSSFLRGDSTFRSIYERPSETSAGNVEPIADLSKDHSLDDIPW